MHLPSLLLPLLPLLLPPTAGALVLSKTCDVLAFGARGDNRTEDTAAVNKAISACHPGGTVVLPANHTFLLRPVQLPGDLTLQVDGNIAAWPDIATWPNSTVRLCSTSPYETPLPAQVLAPQKEALLWSVNASNLRITGNGVVDGAGWRWWPLRKRPGDYWHNCRPTLLSFGRRWPMPWSGVSDVVVEGITLMDSPFWTIQARGLRDVIFDNVKVHTSGCGYAEAPNTDGFNIQGENILVQNSRVRNGDDCVPIVPPTRNVTVRNITCECGNGLAPLIWPSLSIPGLGGNISDVVFEDATFLDTSWAIGVKSMPSFVGQIRNVTWRRMSLSGVGQAVMINVYGQGQADAVAEAGATGHVGTGSVHQVTIEEVSGTADAAGKIACAGGANECDGFAMAHVNLSVTGSGGQGYDCENVRGTQVDCEPKPCGW